MREPYSRRVEGIPDTFTYEIPLLVRNRLLHTIKGFCDGYGFGKVFEYLLNKCLKEFGGVLSPTYMVSLPNNAVQAMETQWNECDTNKFLSMLEWVFESSNFTGNQTAVEAFNRIFRTSAIGYELSPYDEVRNPNTGRMEVFAFPEVTKKTNDLVHTTVSMAALKFLAGPLWSVPNQEMLSAHKHLRNDNFPEAIFQAGCCLESVLKIICTKNNWTIQPDKDTLNPLLQAAHKGGLFPTPYLDIIQGSSGTMRNKWGGHGKAVTTYGPATSEIANNMIQVTSSHVIFLVAQAKLP